MSVDDSAGTCLIHVLTKTPHSGRPIVSAANISAGAPMDHRELQGMIDRVKQGRLSRRGFVLRMAAVGLTAPMATQLLAIGGVAMAQPASTYKPTKRGGGGILKL